MQERQGLYEPKMEHDSCGIGFVADIKGRKSRKIIDGALTILKNMMHRGACGCEMNNGDGAGISLQIPDKFMRIACGFSIPPEGKYGVGMVFLPREHQQANQIEKIFEQTAYEEGCTVLGWREVPTDTSSLGAKAKAILPTFRQFIIGGFEALDDPLDIERKLFIIRKKVEFQITNSQIFQKNSFYIVSLSSRTLIYKGMLTALQLDKMFTDLNHPEMISALSLVHTRFSTNTFPTWPLAHPFRYITHNGEFNTLKGNVNKIRAIEKQLNSQWIPRFEELFPLIQEGLSDSGTFDNILELLHLSGRDLPHALLMMIPEAWQKNEDLSDELKAFYQYHNTLMEPWDGPACIAFTDGSLIGAHLDRNGLRPTRYYTMQDGTVILASEVGVLPVDPSEVIEKQRVKPGQMFIVDTVNGQILNDQQIKEKYANIHPFREKYEKWVQPLSMPSSEIKEKQPHPLSLLKRQNIFGYTQEELKFFLSDKGIVKGDPVNSMGNDASLPVLSNRPRLLFDYFKQLFAQVTNPPIDAIREELVTEVSINLGKQGNLLDPEKDPYQLISIPSPILDYQQYEVLQEKSCTLSSLFSIDQGESGLKYALDLLFSQAESAIKDGAIILILSDLDVSDQMAPVPSLLAVSGLHHYLIRKGLRGKASIVIATGEARQVHHMCTLIGFGASAIYPYLAIETVKEKEKYLSGLVKGMVKVISKMGISTMQSYVGAQIFEAVGIQKKVIDTYFPGTHSAINGIDLATIAKETLLRHHRAFNKQVYGIPSLDIGGELQWKRDGEYHLFNPETVYKLQHATKTGQFEIFKEYTQLIDEQNTYLGTLRGLFQLKWAKKPIPIEDVEPIEAIMPRFSTGGMSYGAISQEAHETLSIAMNRIGGQSNSGEGGEDAERYVLDTEGHLRRSNIHQVASGRFGVTSEYLVNCEALQIKIAQGAKPGEGGQLPGKKVYPWIAKVRNSTPGVELISPPPHHDIYSIEDLAQLIYDLKCSNPDARIDVKLVSEVGVGTVAAGVSKARADLVLISGHDGGTGAAPLTSIFHAGTPWEIGLAETQQALALNGLRERIIVQVDGQMKTGRDVIVGALLGADQFGFGTAPLIVSGCIMMRVCHLNTCPVGVATQDPELRNKFKGKPEFVENYFHFIAQEVREYMAKLGYTTMDEMIGQVDRIGIRKGIGHWKAKGIDFSQLLHKPHTGGFETLRHVSFQNHFLESSLDVQILIPKCYEAIENQTAVSLSLSINNVNRAVGTILGYEITKRYGAKGLSEDTIDLFFKGSAGQSFGAFIPKGITLKLEGDANDYVGKGLSGGKIIAYPPPQSKFKAQDNVIIGNVVLYGATSGEAYFSGIAGDRFCVRNSGANAVVEGVGDHGCEYMTGGHVVILGNVGRNFAAGMTGGIAYLIRDEIKKKINTEHVLIESLDEDDLQTVENMIAAHIKYTNSKAGKKWLNNKEGFIKVIPKDYKKVMEIKKQAELSGKPWEEEVMETLHG